MPPAVRVQLVNDLADIEYVLLPTLLCVIQLVLDRTNICFTTMFTYSLKIYYSYLQG